MKRKRAGAVRLSDHAYERWKLRVGPASKNSVADRIRVRIAAELKNGAEVNRNGALEIEVRPGVWAVCYPSFMGGWVVATIIREGWNEDMEERARYGGERSALLSKEEYKNTQEVLLGQAGIIAMLDLEGFLRTLHHAEDVAPYTDPTLFKKVLYGQGADNLQAIKEIAGAALKMKIAVERFKEKFVEREKQYGNKHDVLTR